MRSLVSLMAVVLAFSGCGGGSNATRYFRVLFPSTGPLPDSCYQAATLPAATTPEEIAAETYCGGRKKSTSTGSTTNTASVSNWTMVDTGDNKLYLVLATSTTSSTGYEGTLNAATNTYSFAATADSFTKSCSPVTGATLVECNGACVNTRSDRNNCGACGDACPAGQQCRLSNCVPMCTTTMQMCGGVTTDTQSDNNNCGFCGNICMNGNICSGGQCSSPCAAACGAQYVASACGNPREFSRKTETKVDFTLTGGQVKGTYGTTQTYACKDPGCPGDFAGRCPTCAQSGTITGREVTNVTEFEQR